MDEGVEPGSAFHVTLDETGNLLWTAGNNGETVQYHQDPGTSFWQRLVIGFVGLLPITRHL